MTGQGTGQAPETFLHKVVVAPPVEDVPLPADVPADDEYEETAPITDEPRAAEEPVVVRDPLLGPAADELMVRWRRAVSAFVDDPPTAYTAGTEVVGEALTQIQAALRARQQDSRDTEVLRQAMLRQRRLLDGLLEM
jgi:hypothetical protein